MSQALGPGLLRKLKQGSWELKACLSYRLVLTQLGELTKTLSQNLKK